MGVHCPDRSVMGRARQRTKRLILDGRLTARVIERVSECHPLQELQMKQISSFYAVHPIFKWKKSGRGLERWTEMSDRDVVVTLMQAGQS